MIPEKFPEANVNMQKPEGWSSEDCADSLPAWHGTQKTPSGSQYPCFISYWKPDADELQDLINGGGVYLSIISSKLPPAALFTKSPFTNEPGFNGIQKD